jgi:hypothetical protein
MMDPENPFAPRDPESEAEWQAARRLAWELMAQAMAHRWGLVDAQGKINMERCRTFIQHKQGTPAIPTDFHD